MVKNCCLLLALFALACAKDLTPEQAGNFTQGLLNGLDARWSTKSECSAQFTSLSNDFLADANDIVAVSGKTIKAKDLTTLYADLNKTVQDAYKTTGACDFTSLKVAVQQLVNSNTTVLSQRLNDSRVSSDEAIVSKCSQNFSACGKASGELLQIALNWDINANNSPNHSNHSNYTWFTPEQAKNFTKGLLFGLNASATTANQSFAQFYNLSNSFFADANDTVTVLGTNYSDWSIHKLYHALNKTLWHARNTTGPYNFTGLSHKVHELEASNGTYLLKQRLNNTSVPRDAFVIKNYTANYTQTGVASGDLLKILLDWNVNWNGTNFTTDIYDDFISGMVEGLDLGQSCLAALSGVKGEIVPIVDGLSEIAAGDTRKLYMIVLQLEGIIDSFQYSQNVCDVDLDVINFADIVAEFALNQADLAYVYNCGRDYHQCGEALGDILQAFLGL